MLYTATSECDEEMIEGREECCTSFFFSASVASVCLRCSYLCVSRPPHKSCRSVGFPWGRLRGTHVWQPWSTTKSFSTPISLLFVDCCLCYISFPFARTPLVLASKHVMNTNRTIARWRHLTATTRILEFVVFLCKLRLLFCNPQRDWQI